MNCELDLKAKKELSHWELSHMINVLGNTYMKLIMIEEMQKLYNKGAFDDDFIIGSQSIELHTPLKELDSLINFQQDEFTILDRKSNNAHSFWNLFNKLNRPIVFYKTSVGYKSLYNSENYIVFKKITTDSPQTFKILGKNISIVIGTLIFETVTGHYIEDFVFEDQNKLLLEQNIEQNKQILENQKLIIKNQKIHQEEIEKIEENIKRVIKNIQEYNENNEKLKYNDFLEVERIKQEKKLKYQIKKTPLTVENIIVV